ncbi:unnamed protein product, partial [Phaeothamnion confervicola]
STADIEEKLSEMARAREVIRQQLSANVRGATDPKQHGERLIVFHKLVLLSWGPTDFEGEGGADGDGEEAAAGGREASAAAVASAGRDSATDASGMAALEEGEVACDDGGGASRSNGGRSAAGGGGGGTGCAGDGSGRGSAGGARNGGSTGSSRSDRTGSGRRAAAPLLPHIPTRFQSVEHYEDCMRTLLLEEVRASLAGGWAKSRATGAAVAAVLGKAADDPATGFTHLTLTVAGGSDAGGSWSRGGGGSSGSYAGWGSASASGGADASANPRRDRGQHVLGPGQFGSNDVVMLRAGNGAVCLGILEPEPIVAGARPNFGELRIKVFVPEDPQIVEFEGDALPRRVAAAWKLGTQGGMEAATEAAEAAAAAASAAKSATGALLADAVSCTGSAWRVERMESIATSSREFVALGNLRRVALMNHILQASSDPFLLSVKGRCGGSTGGGGSAGDGRAETSAGSGGEDARAVGAPLVPPYRIDAQSLRSMGIRLKRATEACGQGGDLGTFGGGPGGAPLARDEAMGILAAFQTFQVSISLLQQAGSVVPILRKVAASHPDETIAAAAKGVCKHWKRTAADERREGRLTEDGGGNKDAGAGRTRPRSHPEAAAENDEDLSLPSQPALLPPALWAELARQYNSSQLQAIWAVAASADELERRRIQNGNDSGDGGGGGGGPSRRRKVAGGGQDGREGEVILLQGPPGTGKTRAVLGVVSSILARRTDTGSGGGDSAGSGSAGSGSAAGAASLAAAPAALQVRPRRRGGGPSHAHQRVLVCAPSNGAVDELTQRLVLEGVWDSDGKSTKPRVVRVGGVGDGCPAKVQEVALRFLVDDRMKNFPGKIAAEEAQTRIAAIHADLLNLAAALDGGGGGGGDYREQQRRGERASEQRRLRNELTEQHKRRRAALAQVEMERRRLQRSFLSEAQVVCATLAGCGGPELVETVNSSAKGFDTVVVDEACQAVETSTLVPLALGCKRLILVGDPRQLPATVISQAAKEQGFELSLFERFERAGHPVHMLTVQYRMLPAIRAFPSNQFYGGRLRDATVPAELATMEASAPYAGDAAFAPLLFYDVGGAERRVGKSVENDAEASFAYDFVETLRRRHFFVATAGVAAAAGGSGNGHGDGMPGGAGGQRSPPSAWRRVAVITSYKRQVRRLRGEFQRRWPAQEAGDYAAWVDISTVDGFQGRECEIVVFSCVRSSPRGGGRGGGGGGIGFLADERRMCVGITRARRCLAVLGNAATLSQNRTWRALVEHCRAKNCLVAAGTGGFARVHARLNSGGGCRGGGGGGGRDGAAAASAADHGAPIAPAASLEPSLKQVSMELALGSGGSCDDGDGDGISGRSD